MLAGWTGLVPIDAPDQRVVQAIRVVDPQTGAVVEKQAVAMPCVDRRLQGRSMKQRFGKKRRGPQTQADVKSAFTVSGTAGIEFLIKRWVGLAAGYNVLRIDTGNVPKSGTVQVKAVETGITQYGPLFTLAFHWAEK